jgi:membrane fusion protein, copper/silver efflux system
MAEQTNSGWKNAMRAFAMLCMKPTLFLVAGILLIVALGTAQRLGWISAGGGGGGAEHRGGSQEKGVLYICPMMCTPPVSEPGRCPVCAMELVPSSTGSGGGDRRSIQIDPASRRVANIRTVAVESVVAAREVRAIGRLSYDEGKLKTLAAYVDGRLDRLYADYTGVVVNEGDELALLYSPELYTAQTELLSVKRTTKSSQASLYTGTLDSRSLLESARRKLIDLGMTERQVNKLEETGQPVTRIELVAPIHGTVIDRLASEGEYVKTGQPIYRLADLSTLWLMLELFPEDASGVRYGQRVVAQVQSLPMREFSGRVAFVDPMVDPKTRTVGVRVVMANQDKRLRVGDYATATIKVPVTGSVDSQVDIYDPDLAGKWISPRHPHVVKEEPGRCDLCGIELVPASAFGFSDEPISGREQLVVPRDAVLMAGDHSVVYVETEPGRFELRQVELGPGLGEEIVLLGGVTEGEQVATSGNFLIDSQMQLAGNPSLIDPEKAESKPTDEAMTPEVLGALAELPEYDRSMAEEQRICPVTEMLLGSMGVPPKVDVGGRTVFICCEGCREPLLQESEKYLAVLDDASQGRKGEELPEMDLPAFGSIEMIEPTAEDSEHDVPPSGDLPPIGPIELIEPAQGETLP